MELKYESKDIDPRITVENAKKFLSSIECFPIYNCHKTLSGAYSAELDGSKWGLTTYGKGITPELCEASAYGEFVERVQNICHGLPFRLVSNIKKEQKFNDWPDERVSLVYDSLLRNKHVFIDFCNEFKEANKSNIDPSIIDMSNVVSKLIDSIYCHEVPFYEVFSNTTQYLPIEPLTLLIGSTGECAGNTPEEALVQGLSEILERFAESNVLRHRLTPPEIPLSFIENNEPDIYNLIKEFLDKTNNRFRLKFYDLSFGNGIPVISTILFDTKYPRYRLQSGSHPLFRIALERCITELEQGINFLDDNCSDSNFVNWTTSQTSLAYDTDNVAAQFSWGFGAVPNEWFFKNPSWDFKPWNSFDNFDNKTALEHLFRIFQNSNFPVYIRNTTLSELYTFIIYVPTISHFIKHVLDSFTFVDSYLWSQQLDVEWEHYLYDEKVNLLNHIKTYGFKCLGPILNPVSQCKLATAIALELGDLDSALYFISQGFPDNKQINIIKSEIELRLQGIDVEDRDNCLLNFFNKEDLKILDDIWRKQDIIFNLYSQPDTFIRDSSLDINALTKTRELFCEKVIAAFAEDNQLHG